MKFIVVCPRFGSHAEYMQIAGFCADHRVPMEVQTMDEGEMALLLMADVTATRPCVFVTTDDRKIVWRNFNPDTSELHEGLKVFREGGGVCDVPVEVDEQLRDIKNCKDCGAMMDLHGEIYKCLGCNAEFGKAEVEATTEPLDVPMVNHEEAPPCTICGAIMVQSGTVYKCSNCGAVFTPGIKALQDQYGH